MHPIEHIRRTVFGVSQSAFSVIAGTTQPSVSRWESGELEPSRAEMARIREAALSAGKNWDDAWFFDIPAVDRIEAERANS